MAAKEKDVDWEAIEREFRANLRSTRQIGKEYGVSDVAILKRAKRDGWTKDLAAAIKAKTEEKVSRAAVRTKVSKEKVANDATVVEAVSDITAKAILAQQTYVETGFELVSALFAELKAASTPELQIALEELAVLKDQEADDPKRTAALEKAYNAAIALPGRAATAQKLVASLGTLIDKQRLILNIGQESNKPQSVGEFLAGLDG